MAEILSNISIASFVIAAICLILAVFCWFKFKIPSVIGDLSGRTARKSIAQMRNYNEETGVKSHRSSAVNVERGRLTASIVHSEKTNKSERSTKEELQETGLLETASAGLPVSEETTLLNDCQETELLVETEETKNAHTEDVVIKELEEIVWVHTQETIDV